MTGERICIMEYKNKYIERLISRMTVDQKVGQMMTLGFAGVVAKSNIYEYITKYHCGGLRLSPEVRTFGAYVNPLTGKQVMDYGNVSGVKYGKQAPVCSMSHYKEVLSDLQRAARNRPLGIPLHLATDMEGGTSTDPYWDELNKFPRPMGLRATDDSRLAYEVAKASARQLSSLGINWIHSPVLDVNSETRNPEIYIRSYSEKAEEVAEYSEQTCRGFKEGGVVATGKHFPGRGHSAIDAHFQLPTIEVGRDMMGKRELLPYKNLIAKGLLPCIMIAHSIFPAYDPDNISTVSKKVITGLLREELGFEGVVTTDSMTMGAIASTYGVANACAMALEAGADLVLMKAENQLVEETFNKIKEFVVSGRISAQDLDDKMYRILSTKYEYGLFHESRNNEESPEEVAASREIIELSKQVARRSVVVARDRKGLLPLCDQDENILIVEQKVKEYNGLHWHSGILHEDCLKYNPRVKYLETDYTFDDADKASIEARLEQYDTIVITNYYLRGSLNNRDFIDSLCKKNPEKKIIVVTNTPYEELSIPQNAGTVIVSFTSAPNNVEVVAGVLFGKMTAEGVWPVARRVD